MATRASSVAEDRSYLGVGMHRLRRSVLFFAALILLASSIAMLSASAAAFELTARGGVASEP